jgi:hypothetical protein
MKIKVAKTVQAQTNSELETATSEPTEVKAEESVKSEVAGADANSNPHGNKFQKVSQSTQTQEIEVIKSFNGLKVGHKMTASRNIAEILILKNLVK